METDVNLVFYMFVIRVEFFILLGVSAHQTLISLQTKNIKMFVVIIVIIISPNELLQSCQLLGL